MLFSEIRSLFRTLHGRVDVQIVGRVGLTRAFGMITSLGAAEKL